MEREQYAYLAGIIDGEGTINIYNRKPNASRGEINGTFNVYLAITNTDLRLLEWIKEVTGVGSVTKDKKRKDREHRQTYRWTAAANDAEEILSKTYEFLVIKKEQADLVFSFRSTYNDGRTHKNGTPELVIQRRHVHMLSLRELHHREFT